MNVTMKLTFDGLIRALRFQQTAMREDISLGRLGARHEREKSSGDQNEEWRGSIAESTL
ncbi:hypothetical protein [Brucella pseudogrignonensis]|uniref:Uncharacterized protein n=1 Tax=Brucella pseudogrignonensis TaxID=419475 RepID=A0ABU1M6W8_9HYPH|nr:hypothetical protein [Brucella pseudogrignonensis]MDR6431481.1 hypothetical protein [Brucella pseudogrignonensis]